MRKWVHGKYLYLYLISPCKYVPNPLTSENQGPLYTMTNPFGIFIPLFMSVREISKKTFLG